MMNDEHAANSYRAVSRRRSQFSNRSNKQLSIVTLTSYVKATYTT